MRNSGLSDFYSLVQDFGNLQSVVFKVLVALPLLGIWLKLAPPTNAVSASLLSIIEFLVLMAAFAAWGELPVDKLRRRFFLTTAICVVGLVSVVYLFMSYTVSCDANHATIIGTQLLTDVAKLISPSYTTTQAVIDSSCDASKVWTGPSVNLMTGIFLFAWSLAVSGFTAAVVAFVLYEKQRQALPGEP